MRGHLLEVVPARKQLSRGREDDDPDRFVIARIVQLGLQQFHYLYRQGVNRRVLEGQAKDSAVPFHADQACVAREFGKIGQVGLRPSIC